MPCEAALCWPRRGTHTRHTSSLEKPYLRTPTASTTSQFTIRPCHRPRHTQHSAPSRAPTAVLFCSTKSPPACCALHTTPTTIASPRTPTSSSGGRIVTSGLKPETLGAAAATQALPSARDSAVRTRGAAARAHKRAAAAHQRVAGITAQCSRHRSCSQLDGTQRRACSSSSKAATAAGACASLAPSSAPRNQASHLKQSAMLLGLTDLYHRNTAASNNTTMMTPTPTIPHCPPAPRC